MERTINFLKLKWWCLLLRSNFQNMSSENVGAGSCSQKPLCCDEWLICYNGSRNKLDCIIYSEFILFWNPCIHRQCISYNEHLCIIQRQVLRLARTQRTARRTGALLMFSLCSVSPESTSRRLYPAQIFAQEFIVLPWSLFVWDLCAVIESVLPRIQPSLTRQF